jgi:DNA-binding transcriptional LysR family regulator
MIALDRDLLHVMNISAFDLNRAKALHYLLEEAHVGRAAALLGITAAAASNALRRLRDELGDPLLVKRGRGLVRTRLGEELRGPARGVVAAAQLLLRTARPFDPSLFDGELPLALAEHVAAMLLPGLDRLARERAPRATLTIAAVPLDIADWLKKSGGVLVGPSGPFAATTEGDALVTEDFYSERYVCVMRRGHPLADRRLSAELYVDQDHVLVVPRGLTARSDVDSVLGLKGLVRRVARTVPSFHLGIPVILQSDLITTMPERSARQLHRDSVVIKELPLELPPLLMKMIVHPAHEKDGRNIFVRMLLRHAFDLV